MKLRNLFISELKRQVRYRALKPQSIADIRTAEFHKQNAYLNDRAYHRYRSMCCTRRAGKTNAEAMDDVEIGFQFDNSRMLYGAVTVETAYDLIWDVFFSLDEKFKLGLKPNKGKYKIIWPNGTELQLLGLDASERLLKKLLGRKLRKVGIDESGSISTGLERIVKKNIKPALADLRPYSWLTLLGTPEEIPNTYFETVDAGKDLELNWSNHRWTAYDNPYMVKQWSEEIDEMVKNNPNVVNLSWYRTHYLGEWCTDETRIIIKFKDEVNYVDKLPESVKDWWYVLGIDLGFNDATAFSVIAFSDKLKEAYVVMSYKESEMIFDDVGAEIKRLQTLFPFSKYIIDGANKQGVESLKERLGLNLEAADKQDKASFLRMLDSDVQMGRVKVLKGRNDELVAEWKSLIWNKDKQEEDARCENHLSDATLYAWRSSRHYLWTPDDKHLDKFTKSYMDDLERREAEKLKEKLTNRRRYG